MLEIVEEKIGAIQSDSITERGKVIAAGPDCKEAKEWIGKTLYFKAWALDVITDNGKKLDGARVVLKLNGTIIQKTITDKNGTFNITT